MDPISMTQDLLNVASSSSTLESFCVKSEIGFLNLDVLISERSWAVTVSESDEVERYIGELISK